MSESFLRPCGLFYGASAESNPRRNLRHASAMLTFKQYQLFFIYQVYLDICLIFKFGHGYVAPCLMSSWHSFDIRQVVRGIRRRWSG